jgi:5S rRNA maturation endonuclease (ribonuclease M5)
MIGEAIKKKGEKGSGGGRDAFVPGAKYVCGKALRVELLNLTSPDWTTAGDEMALTSELSARVQKPYYHLVLSWHEQEQPTLDQQFEAMNHTIKRLGLDEHQIVIGSHDDRDHCHIHAIANTVHPTTGKVWSKSNDHMKIEKACREIELKQGWTHDRGRFDFDVIEKDGAPTVQLKPAPEVWEKKTQAREEGRRKPSPGDIAFQKHHGFESFGQDIPPALRDRFAQIVGIADSWDALHESLSTIGLKYLKAGSGARVHLIGSEEYAKASIFGQKFSMKNLEVKLGEYKYPKTDHKKDQNSYLQEINEHTNSVSEDTPKEHKKHTVSASFKLTLLRRAYTEIYLDDDISSQIHYVKLDGLPPKITFKDRSEVVDHGHRITASATTEATVKATIAMAKAKGWSTIIPTGSPDWIRNVAIEAARSGIPVSGVSADIQTLADEIIERTLKKQRRLDQESASAQTAHLESTADREDALNGNRSEEARRAAEAILGSDTAIPTNDAGRPSVPKPQPAPDAAKSDPGGARRIQHQMRENDRSEIEDMKRVDISIIAQMGGWSDASRTHPDSSDPHGKKYRIFQRDSDTIKTSLVDGKWLWTSNKSGGSGSVIDLWQHDNPGRTLGHARAAFRDILGTTAPLPALTNPVRQSSAPPEDHTEARRRWQEAPYVDPVTSASNYAVQRGISPSTLARFSDQVRVGPFGGVLFAHRNIETGDIQGFEQRWQKDGRPNQARFAKGGRKTVSILGNPETATRMVVFEGGLDALALAEMEANADTIYVSTGGGFGQLTEDTLKRLAKGRKVLSGFDNDAAGEAMHAKLLEFLPEAHRETPPLRIEGMDATCKDWLDVLNAVNEAPKLSSEGPKTPSQALPGLPSEDLPAAQPEDEPERPDFS